MGQQHAGRASPDAVRAPELGADGAANPLTQLHWLDLPRMNVDHPS